MAKSVKELIYDYLKNGQEATIANKMRCFNTVQNMFTQIRRVPLPDGLGESGGNISQMMGRRRSLKERDVYHYFFGTDVEVTEGVLLKALYPKLEDGIAMSNRVRSGDGDAFLSTKADMVSLDTWRLKMKRHILHASIYSQVLHNLRETRYTKALNMYRNDHSSRTYMQIVPLNHPDLVPSSLIAATDFDGDCYPNFQENKMNYIVKLMTTDLFHNEVTLVSSLISRLNDSRYTIIGNSRYASEFEKILDSMAALGQASITLDDHELVTQLIDRNLPGSPTRLTLTAPTEDNPAVIATFYVVAERDLPSMPVFAVSIIPATEENKDDMKELEKIVDSYCEISRDVVGGYLAGHLPIRCSQILKNLTIEPYDPKCNAYNPVRGLDLSEVMLTAGKHVEWLLGNPVKLQEYIAALDESGVIVDIDNIPMRSAFWSEGDHGHSGWMIVPVETELGSEQMSVTVYASEDDLINYHAPRRYREAEVIVNREKAMRFAGNFFETEDAE